MSFQRDLTGSSNLYANVILNTNISASSVSTVNLSATNASFTNITTNTWTTGNVSTPNVIATDGYFSTINACNYNAPIINASNASFINVSISNKLTVSNISNLHNIFSDQVTTMYPSGGVVIRDINQSNAGVLQLNYASTPSIDTYGMVLETNKSGTGGYSKIVAGQNLSFQVYADNVIQAENTSTSGWTFYSSINTSYQTNLSSLSASNISVVNLTTSTLNASKIVAGQNFSFQVFADTVIQAENTSTTGWRFYSSINTSYRTNLSNVSASNLSVVNLTTSTLNASLFVVSNLSVSTVSSFGISVENICATYAYVSHVAGLVAFYNLSRDQYGDLYTLSQTHNTCYATLPALRTDGVNLSYYTWTFNQSTTPPFTIGVSGISASNIQSSGRISVSNISSTNISCNGITATGMTTFNGLLFRDNTSIPLYANIHDGLSVSGNPQWLFEGYKINEIVFNVSDGTEVLNLSKNYLSAVSSVVNVSSISVRTISATGISVSSISTSSVSVATEISTSLMNASYINIRDPTGNIVGAMYESGNKLFIQSNSANTSGMFINRGSNVIFDINVSGVTLGDNLYAGSAVPIYISTGYFSGVTSSFLNVSNVSFVNVSATSITATSIRGTTLHTSTIYASNSSFTNISTTDINISSLYSSSGNICNLSVSNLSVSSFTADIFTLANVSVSSISVSVALTAVSAFVSRLSSTSTFVSNLSASNISVPGRISVSNVSATSISATGRINADNFVAANNIISNGGTVQGTTGTFGIVNASNIFVSQQVNMSTVSCNNVSSVSVVTNWVDADNASITNISTTTLTGTTTRFTTGNFSTFAVSNAVVNMCVSSLYASTVTFTTNGTVSTWGTILLQSNKFLINSVSSVGGATGLQLGNGNVARFEVSPNGVSSFVPFHVSTGNFCNIVTTGTVSSSVISCSTLNVSTFPATITTTTVNASTVNASTTNSSTENATTVNASTVNASTTNSSTENATTVNASTMNASTANASTVNASTANASTANASTANASSMNTPTMNASTINVSTVNSTTVNVSTMNASSSNISNLSVANGSITTISSTSFYVSNMSVSRAEIWEIYETYDMKSTGALNFTNDGMYITNTYASVGGTPYLQFNYWKSVSSVLGQGWTMYSDDVRGSVMDGGNLPLVLRQNDIVQASVSTVSGWLFSNVINTSYQTNISRLTVSNLSVVNTSISNLNISKINNSFNISTTTLPLTIFSVSNTTGTGIRVPNYLDGQDLTTGFNIGYNQTGGFINCCRTTRFYGNVLTDDNLNTITDTATLGIGQNITTGSIKIGSTTMSGNISFDTTGDVIFGCDRRSTWNTSDLIKNSTQLGSFYQQTNTVVTNKTTTGQTIVFSPNNANTSLSTVPVGLYLVSAQGRLKTLAGYNASVTNLNVGTCYGGTYNFTTGTTTRQSFASAGTVNTSGTTNFNEVVSFTGLVNMSVTGNYIGAFMSVTSAQAATVGSVDCTLDYVTVVKIA